MDKEEVVWDTHIHTVGYYSAIKKNEILPFVTWMDLEYNAKQNKSVRERQIPYNFTHTWNLRTKTNEQRGKKGEASQDTDC